MLLAARAIRRQDQFTRARGERRRSRRPIPNGMTGEDLLNKPVDIVNTAAMNRSRPC